MNVPPFITNFTLKDHLPVIMVHVGKDECYLALDTGHFSNYLSSEFFEKYGNKNILLPSAGEGVGRTVSIITIQGREFMVPMVIKELNNPAIVGVLGSGFMHRWRMVIDYGAELLYSFYQEEDSHG